MPPLDVLEPLYSPLEAWMANMGVLINAVWLACLTQMLSDERKPSAADAQRIGTQHVYIKEFLITYMLCPCRFHTSGVTFHKWG